MSPSCSTTCLATLELAIATRLDPPLPLARLRTRGEMLELRTAELRFDEEEAEELLAEVLGDALTDTDVERLVARTEGWPAGLYLAALSLGGREDAAGFIEAFAGDDRHIVDYLGGEVLEGIEPETREFLLRTSILERLCGAALRPRAGRAATRRAGCSRSSARTSSSSRWTGGASGTATTISSATCSATSSSAPSRS